ncbi:LysR substrate-binding domain-containing protein [Myxococcus sp. CA051A]|uniref:LysR substrate-binding domain-containing protein n=1 Tax=Myxococcus sp. CA051A TaxID=2741739 RepID=UPI0020C64D4C|nr:LysR substrate-binding domain-containing protein [Myxococcus sp. CA051A]
MRGLPCIRFARGQYSRWEFERDAEEVLVEADGRLSLNDQGLMVDAALAGVGLADVFEARVTSLLEQGRRVRVLEDGCPSYAGFFLYSPSRRQLHRLPPGAGLSMGAGVTEDGGMSSDFKRLLDKAWAWLGPLPEEELPPWSESIVRQVDMKGSMSSDFKRGQSELFTGLLPRPEGAPWTKYTTVPVNLNGVLPTDFKLRLAETIAWCLPRAEAARAGDTTRTAELMPPVCGHDGDTFLDLVLKTPDVPREAVGFITERRREALARMNMPLPPLGDLAGGWVFATDFSTDICGAATAPSNGFLDDYDVPGWDTWFAHQETGEMGGIIYGWVPPALLTLAEKGFYVIPVTSAWWLRDEDLRRLMSS